MTTTIHDVLIIGAGPAGLAVAARLREPTPSALFTDAEHNRYQWIKKYSGRMNLRPRERNSQISKCSSTSRRNADKYQPPGTLSIKNSNLTMYHLLARQKSPATKASTLKSSTAAAAAGYPAGTTTSPHSASPIFEAPCSSTPVPAIEMDSSPSHKKRAGATIASRLRIVWGNR